MRIASLPVLVSVAVLSVGLGRAVNVHAATAPAPTQSAIAENVDPLLTRLDNGAEAATLEQSYMTLAVADHDYKGHRVKAMKAISAACKDLGVTIKGDGRGHEKQKFSDAQLRSVLATIQQVRASIPAGKGQKKVLGHLNTAINELTIALTIK